MTREDHEAPSGGARCETLFRGRYGAHDIHVDVLPSSAMPEKYARLRVFVEGPGLNFQPDFPRWEMDIAHAERAS